MSRSRALAVAVLAVASLALTACGGGSASEVAQSVASSAASTAEASSSAPAPAESSASATPSEDSSSPEPAAGGASDFCGAFTELDSLPDDASEADAVAAFRGAAADMRKYAPAEITDSVEKYATAIEAVADTIETKNIGGSGVSQALQTVLAENAKDIGTVAVYVGKNC
jgi:hypothetical protein